MKVVFIAICIGWFASFVIWCYTIISKRQRENFNYIYPLIAMLCFNAVMLLYAY